MKAAAWVTLFYGLLIIIGGVIGHIQAASTASLVMGSIFGILLLIAAIGMFRDRLLPTYFGILLILLLDAFFTYRWLYTLQFIPSGAMCLISLAVFIAVLILIRNHLNAQKAKKK